MRKRRLYMDLERTADEYADWFDTSPEDLDQLPKALLTTMCRALRAADLTDWDDPDYLPDPEEADLLERRRAFTQVLMAWNRY